MSSDIPVKLTAADWNLITNVKDPLLAELIQQTCHNSNERLEHMINRFIIKSNDDAAVYKEEYVKDLTETYELLVNMMVHYTDNVFTCVVKGCYGGDQGLNGWKSRHPGKYAAIELFANRLRSKGFNPQIEQIHRSGGLMLRCDFSD